MPTVNVTVAVKNIDTANWTNTGNPISGVTVHLYEWPSMVRQASAITGANGNAVISFEYSGAATDVANWRVVAKGNNTILGGAKIDSIAGLTGAGTVYISMVEVPPPPPQPIQVEVTIHCGGSTDGNGNPIVGTTPLAGASIVLYDASNVSQAIGTTDANGYAILSLNAGAILSISGWWVRADKAGYDASVGSCVLVNHQNSLIGQALIEVRATGT